MAHGDRAQKLSNSRKDYWAKRKFNKSQCFGPSRKAMSQPSSCKKMTNRAERRTLIIEGE